ncbi:unnamed protein product [Schistocephalus solidus]|uniref:dCTP deaminase n=1 Tax=Schistocephalus solidus TaxID=70667 RepID=A0A183SML7_SCHSO|nr:unnamed protein product [Schistocephalus solidus]
MIRPAPKDLRFLSEQGSYIGTDKRGGSFDGRSVDSLVSGEEVPLFVAFRVPLDLLGLAGHPGVLYLSQPLLYKVATSVEGWFVCSGRAID